MKLRVFNENCMPDDRKEIRILFNRGVHQRRILSTHSIFRWTTQDGLGSNSIRVHTEQNGALVQRWLRFFDGVVLPGHCFRNVTR